MSTTSTLTTITADTNLYAPLVLGAIQIAEAAAPAGTTGSQKAELVTSAISYQLATATGVPPNVQAIAGLVNIGVSLLNAFGVFVHKTAATPAPAQ